MLSRNIFFYKNIKLPDNFETRLYLIFVHLSILMIIYRNRNSKFNQNLYDSLFHNIENDQRELGFGDVSVNKKMKDFNKILYDILLKIKKNKEANLFILNHSLIKKYFVSLNQDNTHEFKLFEDYLKKFLMQI